MIFYTCQDKDQSSASWLSVQANIVNWLLDPAKGGLGETFSTQEVNRAIGLLQTNAINMEKLYKGQIVSCKVKDLTNITLIDNQILSRPCIPHSPSYLTPVCQTAGSCSDQTMLSGSWLR